MLKRIRMPRGGLWNHHDFLRVWSAETVSMFGSQIATFAVPIIAAITLDASPMQMGILTAAGPAPRLLIGFVAGAWADRLPRRPIMIASNVGQILASSIIPIAALTGHFGFNILLIAALLSGFIGVFFDAAWTALLPKLVGTRQLSDATSKLMGSSSLAQILGPALGGIIVGWIGGPKAMWIPVVTFATSAWFLSRMQMQEVVPQRGEDASTMWNEVKEGLKELWREPAVLALMNSQIAINLGGYIFLSVYVLFLTRDLELSSRGVGLVFAVGGVGALLGAVVAPRIARSIGIGNSILYSVLGFGIANLLVPVAILWKDAAIVLVSVSEALAWFALMIFNINRYTLRQALTPDALRGRVGASTMTLVYGAIMAGSLIGGVVGEKLGIHTALYVGIVIMGVAAWWIWRSPVPGFFDVPED